MERIGVRELRQNASKHLERVRRGESLGITQNGRLVAILSPPHPAQTARERLIAEGRLVPASRAWVTPKPVPAPAGAPTTAEALDAEREERL